MSVVFRVFFGDGGFEMDAAAAGVFDLAPVADGDDFGGAFGFEPEADGFGEDGIGALVGELGLGEEQVKLIQWQRDRDGTHHLFFHPGGDGAFAALPFDDGLSGASAKFGGEFLAGESA